MNEKDNKTLVKKIYTILEDEKPKTGIIIIYKLFIKMFGNKDAAALLSQLLYWTPRATNDEGWIYKTRAEWKEEIDISKNNLSKFTAVFKEKGILKTTLKKQGKTPKIHYKLDLEALYGCIAIHKYMPKNDEKIPTVPIWTVQNRTVQDCPEMDNDIHRLHTDIISKDIIKGNSDEFPKSFNLIIEYWNNITISTKHKNTNTKTYKNIEDKIKRLQNGSFYKFYEISKKQINDYKINNKLLTHKWTKNEIKENLQNMSKLFINGYYPPDKSRLPRSLDGLLFNFHTGFSWFFAVKVVPVKLLSESIEIVSKNPDILKMYQELFCVNKDDHKSYNDLIYKTNDIIDEINKIYKNVSAHYKSTSFSSYFGSEKNMIPFIRLHITWLKQREELKIINLLVSGYGWKNFIDDIGKFHDKILYPDKQQLEKWKK